MARPLRLLGAGLTALLAACGQIAGGAAGVEGGPPPLPGPAEAAPAEGVEALLLLPDRGDRAIRGWVAARAAGPLGPALPAVPFIYDPAIDDPAMPEVDETPIPVVFLGGDRRGSDPAAMTPIWRAQAREAMARAGLNAPLLTLGRPFAGDPDRWRTAEEIAALSRALSVLGRAYGFGRADALGHSSGAHLAVALAQETGRLRLIAAAAPPLDLLTWHADSWGGASSAVRRQYDPVAHVADFTAEKIVLVADPLDQVTPPKAWQGWLGRASALGKPASLLFARGGGENRHGLILPGAEALAAMRAGAPIPGEAAPR